MSNKSFSERMRDAIVKSDAEKDVEQAIFILKQAIESEITQFDRLTSATGFYEWVARKERLDFAALKVKARR